MTGCFQVCVGLVAVAMSSFAGTERLPVVDLTAETNRQTVIAEGAKIEIDASGLTTLKGGRKRIVTAEKGVRGAFDASNVEIIEPTAASDEVKERIRKGTIVSDATGLFFRPAPQGLLMIVR